MSTFSLEMRWIPSLRLVASALPLSRAMSSYSFISSATAAKIDAHLMSEAGGHTLPQLMELAGLAVSQSVFLSHPPTTTPSVLLLVGPGNNGGDALVSARHLKLFGYERVQAVMPRLPKNGAAPEGLFEGLVKSCAGVGVEMLDAVPDSPSSSSLVIDGVFGFSFDASSGVRPPYDTLLSFLSSRQAHSFPVLSIDIPSGWSVDDAASNSGRWQPDTLVSLTAPKQGVKDFKGRHFLGGRFLTKPAAKSLFDIDLPHFPGCEQIVELPSSGSPSPPSCIDQSSPTGFSVVYITAPNADVASSLGEKLVANHFAACVNIVPNVKSVYEWKGNLETDDEILLIAKVRSSAAEGGAERFKEFVAFVKANHPYETPEIIELPVIAGSDDYLSWVHKNTSV